MTERNKEIRWKITHHLYAMTYGNFSSLSLAVFVHEKSVHIVWKNSNKKRAQEDEN
jgi:hypothetical protein